MAFNRTLQEFFAKKLADSQAVAVKTSLDVMIELYKKKIWNDKKTVNIISTACYSKSAKIMVAALKLFLGNEEGEQDEDSSSDEDEKRPSVMKAMIATKVNKKSSKRKSKLEKIKKIANTHKKKKNQKEVFDFSALHLINDPQTLAENIFKLFQKRNERFEVKLLMLNMISRLIGVHSLYLHNFFPTLVRFLTPSQREVTKIMTYAAQATHTDFPPNEVYPVLRTLADNFVTERHAPEVMAMGLNAIREICNRNHHAIDEDLLQDLVEYKSHKDKGVYMAARSIMTLYRKINPALLTKKTRGMPTELLKETNTEAKFGEFTAKDYIPGAEILAFQTRDEDFLNPDSDVDLETSDEEDEPMEEDSMTLNEDSMTLNEDSMMVNEDSMMVNEDSIMLNEDSMMVNEDSILTNDDDSILEEGGSDESEIEDEADEYDESCDDSDVEETEIPTLQKSSQDLKRKKNESHELVMKKKEAIKQALELSAEERAAKSADIVSTRFLTDEEFARIDAMQAAKQVERFKNKKGELFHTGDGNLIT